MSNCVGGEHALGDPLDRHSHRLPILKDDSTKSLQGYMVGVPDNVKESASRNSVLFEPFRRTGSSEVQFGKGATSTSTGAHRITYAAADPRRI
jgi:hypothetical protein